VHVTVSDGRGRPVRDGGLARWLVSAAPVRARGDVAIALVSDRRAQALNVQYRRQNRATDVLSFPSGDDSGVSTHHLGDIVIATGVARRQAREARHAYATELRVLALHGLLHLLGYDHEAPEDNGRMARVESRLRRQAGLAPGLIERTRETGAPGARRARASDGGGRAGRRQRP
jgi:probable rRNA maturation factor